MDLLEVQRRELSGLARRLALLPAVLIAALAVVLAWELSHGDPAERALLHAIAAALLLGLLLAAYTAAQVRRIRSGYERALRESDERARQLDRERAERAAELERAVRDRTRELTNVNRELESFSYSVSHDLRAPLRAMDGFGRVLEEQYGPALDAQGRDWLARIRGGARRMADLIDDLLQLSRVSRGELRRTTVDLTRMAREVAAEVEEREPGRPAQWVIEEGMSAWADARLLRVALVNLLGNAHKFSRQAAAPRIEVGASHGRDGTAYHVRDNGAGFDMAYAGKLFQPFQRLHAASEFEGTGIGLATLQRIVHRHGGSVRAEGRPGAGATFWFTLEERWPAPGGEG